MKKLQLYLSFTLLLFLFAGIAGAQITNVGQKLTSAVELEDGKTYAIKAVGASAQGFLYEKTKTVYVSAVADLTTLSAEDANSYIFTAEKKTDEVYGMGDYWVFKANSNGYLPASGSIGAKLATSAQYPVYSEVTGTSAGFRFTHYDSDANDLVLDVVVPYTGTPYLSFSKTSPESVNGLFEIYPVNDESLLSVNIKYNIKIGEALKVYKEEVAWVSAGTVITAPEFPLLKLDPSVSSVVAETSGQTVNFIYTENLPFITSNSYEDAKWYAVDIYSEVQSYMWKFNGMGEKLSAPVTPYVNAFGVSDSLLWCFVGNMADGFKIYNKQAGADAALAYGTDSYPVLAADGSDNLWQVVPGTYDASVCFYPKGDESRIMRYKSGNVSYGTLAGGATSCRFIPCVAFAYNFLKMCYSASVNTGYNDALGVSSYIHNKLIANKVYSVIKDYETHEEYKFSEPENMKEMVDLLYANYIPAVVVDNTPYVFFCSKVGGSITAGATADAGVSVAGTIDAAKSNISSIVLMEPAGDGTYYLKIQGGYLSLDGTKIVSSKSDAAVVEVKHQGEAIFTIKSVGQSRILYYSVIDGKLGVTTERQEEGNWFLIPVEEFDLNMGRSYGSPAKTYATRCFPFAVQLPATGLKAYVATGETETSITLEAIEQNEDGKVVIPARTPILLHGTLAVESLRILGADRSSYTGENKFGGVLFKEYIPANVLAYILAKKDSEVVPKFYKLAEDDQSRYLNANRAYYISNGLMQTSFAMKFKDVVSGIEDVVVEDADAEVYYDLNGHRVLYPVRGIYVTKSGKKVFLK